MEILHDSPSRRVDENVLAIELGVQKTAARQYLKELNRLGLFGDDGAPTDLARKWRQDGDDQDVIQQILEGAYPQELRDLAPIDRLDRDKIARWFVSKGLGGGAAQNKAATYIRIASGVSSIDSKPASASGPKQPRTPQKRPPTGAPQTTKNTAGSETGESNGSGHSGGGAEKSGGRPELNVNVQIHISADSTPEQIDAIFSAMRKYFDGDTTS